MTSMRSEANAPTTAISVFDLFKVGIGPSSSHTVGPMKAARMFAEELRDDGLMPRVHTVRVRLYGSLGLTGQGHGSDKAVLLGLEGEQPATVDVDTVASRLAAIAERHALRLLGEHEIGFSVAENLEFNRRDKLSYHPNGMRFSAYDKAGAPIRERVYYPVGGGFVSQEPGGSPARPVPGGPDLPYPFRTAAGLLDCTARSGLPVSGIMLANEQALGRTAAQVETDLGDLWHVMQVCVQRGCRTDGVLPGRPAGAAAGAGSVPAAGRRASGDDPLRAMDGDAVRAGRQEENAARGRVVTAPTNRAAGIIPAVLHYYEWCVPGASQCGVTRFLLTAAAIGALFKENASISGAEVGCQVRSDRPARWRRAGSPRCSAGRQLRWKTPPRSGSGSSTIWRLTCNPVGGLVQVPCIERNAVASITAINAARIAPRGDGQHFVSLDKAINTMRATGRDMLDIYKETSRGGLAVNVIEC